MTKSKTKGAPSARDLEALEELVRTDYEGDEELEHDGQVGARAARSILTQWSINDPAAARLIERLGDRAAELYLECWERVHADRVLDEEARS